jgi:alkylation response protein AidB-like acyl-CoA dehydrogenase
MDFSFTEEQQDVADLSRQILTDKVTHESLTALEATGEPRFDPDLYKELAKANLLGIGVAEDAGGSGMGLLGQSLVLREIGRTLAPVPVAFSIAMAAEPIALLGTAEQKAAWAAPAVEGSKILTAALAEPHNREPLHPTTTATKEGDGWRLDGVKTGVPAATIADLILVPAWLDGAPAVFLVEPGADGLTITAQHTTNFDTYGYVELSGVVVGADAVLGGDVANGADVLTKLVERATLALCAVQLGVTERALEATAQYTKERVQFERPIATFQAVGHRCADSYIDVEAIRLTLWQAIYSIENDAETHQLDVETAKFWASEGGHRVAHAVVHLHGGMGIATEYFIHRYFAHAKQIEFMLGAATEQTVRIGSQLALQG